MNKVTKEMIEVAADWWVTQLSAPRFDNLGETRGQDPKETLTNGFASMLARLNADQHAPSEEQLATFREALCAAVQSAEFFPGSLYVDYHPDRFLSAAAEKAQIDTSRFPWKSGTWFYEGTVTAASGYGVPRATIFPKEAA